MYLFFSLLFTLFTLLSMPVNAYASDYARIMRTRLKFKNNNQYLYTFEGYSKNDNSIEFQILMSHPYDKSVLNNIKCDNDNCYRIKNIVAETNGRLISKSTFSRSRTYIEGQRIHDCRLSNKGDTIIDWATVTNPNRQGGTKCIIEARNLNFDVIETLVLNKDFEYVLSSGEVIKYKFWHKYDSVGISTPSTSPVPSIPPQPEVITKEIYIKPDYSSIKSAFDSVMNKQIIVSNNVALGLKDYRLGFSYSDYELKSFIENATYSDLMIKFNNYSNGINLSYMPSPNLAYGASINSDNDMINYINSVGSNCESQINYLDTYGKAFISAYNSKYRYLQSMQTTDLKRLLAFCINSDSSLLGKCIYIYKDLIGIHSKIYLPSNYVKTAFREYHHYDGATWYSLQDGQLEALECIQYDIPSNIGQLSVR